MFERTVQVKYLDELWSLSHAEQILGHWIRYKIHLLHMKTKLSIQDDIRTSLESNIESTRMVQYGKSTEKDGYHTHVMHLVFFR